MIADTELSPEAQKACDLAEKLLRLAGRNPNQEEAAAATAKAMDIMASFNLDLTTVEQNSGDSGKRADEKLKGGHFEFQRNLWNAVAKLNFCLYFSLTVKERSKGKMVLKDANKPHLGYTRSWNERYVRQHHLVGRVVNVRSTKAMANYLEQTIERLTRERLGERYGIELSNLSRSQIYDKWANDYRGGISEAICEKLYDRRQDLMSEERQKAEEAARAAREKDFDGAVMSTAITLKGLSESEEDANMEVLHPGYIARKAARKAQDIADRAARAKRTADAEAAWTAWAAANPIEARLQMEKAKKERLAEQKRDERNARRRTGRWYSEPKDPKDTAARREGFVKGQSVSIDQQADARRSKGLLGG